MTVQPIDKRIVRRIYGSGRGAVFTPTQFLDLGSRGAVDVALHRLAKAGTIRRLTRGLNDYPKQHPTFGVMSPPRRWWRKRCREKTPLVSSHPALMRPTCSACPIKCQRRLLGEPPEFEAMIAALKGWEVQFNRR